VAIVAARDEADAIGDTLDALAVRPPAADHPGSVDQRVLGGSVLRRVVGHPDLGPGKGPGERLDAGPDSVSLVARGDYHQQVGHRVRR
jgi:hypothetical protein